jgi:hypothetical protein
MEPTRATTDSKPTPRKDIEKLFGLEKWSPRGQQLTAGSHLDIEKSYGLEKGAAMDKC